MADAPGSFESLTTPLDESRALRLIAAALDDNLEAHQAVAEEIAGCDHCWHAVVAELVEIVGTVASVSDANLESWRQGLTERLTELLDLPEVAEERARREAASEEGPEDHEGPGEPDLYGAANLMCGECIFSQAADLIHQTAPLTPEQTELVAAADRYLRAVDRA